MMKIVVLIPEEQKETVKSAMFNAGGGKIGAYDCCSFELKGEGQFRPLDGAKPFIGEKDKIETVVEYRVEMVCADEKIREVVSAMKAAHPYETPAYDVMKLEKL